MICFNELINLLAEKPSSSREDETLEIFKEESISLWAPFDNSINSVDGRSLKLYNIAVISSNLGIRSFSIFSLNFGDIEGDLDIKCKALIKAVRRSLSNSIKP